MGHPSLNLDSFACLRLSHSSSWDVSRDNVFDFHFDLGCLRGWLTPWGLFPDKMAFHWPHLLQLRVSAVQSFLHGDRCAHSCFPTSFPSPYLRQHSEWWHFPNLNDMLGFIQGLCELIYLVGVEVLYKNSDFGSKFGICNLFWPLICFNVYVFICETVIIFIS